jgi:hypothetical protein
MDPLVGFCLAVALALFVAIYAMVDQDIRPDPPNYPLE